MTRRISLFAIAVLMTFPFIVRAQFGFNSKRETMTVEVSHPPSVSLPNVKRVAVRAFIGRCGGDAQSLLEQAITQSGKLELVDRSLLGEVINEQNLQASAFSNQQTAVKAGQVAGAAAMISGRVTRCSADTSAKRLGTYKDRNQNVHTNYGIETTAHLSMTVQVIDVTTSKVSASRVISFDVPEGRQATDAMPEAVDGAQLLGNALTSAVGEIRRMILPWRESVQVIVHADKECDLKPASDQIRVGNFAAAAEMMQQAIARQCGAPDDKVALAKAYHNMGVALTYAGNPDDGLKALRQSNMLWRGDISEAAMVAASKIIQAREEQKRQDAQVARNGQATEAAAVMEEAALMSNADVLDMAHAKLSDQIIVAKIKSSKCKFDTRPAALIQLKKGGVTDAVVLALNEAQCGR